MAKATFNHADPKNYVIGEQVQVVYFSKSRGCNQVLCGFVHEVKETKDGDSQVILDTSEHHIDGRPYSSFKVTSAKEAFTITD